MSVRSAAVVCVSVLAMAAGSGCCLWPGGPDPCPAADTIVPVHQVVSEYNANASRVSQVWAKAKIEVTMPKLGIPFTWGSTDSGAEPNGLLMLFKSENSMLGPHDFVLIGREVGVDVFRIGCYVPDDMYYFWFGMGEEATLAYGRISLAGAPGVAGLPIDPLQVSAVLGICELPGDLTKPPIVAQTMNLTPGQCAYVLTYIDRQPITHRLLARREVYFRWSDGEPRRPFMVKLFDNRGVRVMTAEMKDYARIKLADDDDEATGPVMATDVRISWPNEKSSVHIVLDRMCDHKGKRIGCKLPDDLAVKKVIQVDREILKGAAGK